MSTAAATHFLTAPAVAQRWRARLSATWLLHTNARVLDVETTGFQGRVCEIAVLDTSGDVLLDTLVDPQVPIPEAARRVHGITSAQVDGAPTWEQLAPTVEQLLAGRTVIAYNAPFDHSRIRAEQQLLGRGTPGRWWCLMRARSAVDGGAWQALNGGHRAAGDCRAALEVLQELAIGSRRGQAGSR